MYSRMVLLPKPVEWGFPGEGSDIPRLFNIDIHDAVYGILKDCCQEESTVIEDLIEYAVDVFYTYDDVLFNQYYQQATVFINNIINCAYSFLYPYIIDLTCRYRIISIESFITTGYDGYLVQLLVSDKHG